MSLLTGASNKTQRRAFARLQRSSINRESLYFLRHSFLTLCLDFDLNPPSYAEAAKIAQIGNCSNRWYHSSLQLVVFGNAKTCVICNYSTYLDGNTMMRGAAELQRRAITYQVNHGKAKTSHNLVQPIKLQWSFNKSFIKQAQRDIQWVKDDQTATFEIEYIGTTFFSDHKLAPVPTFILALQMTANHFVGKSVKITQLLSMSKYRCMDLEIAIVTTPEVERFVKYMGKKDMQPEEADRLLREAINSQQRECRRSRRYLPVPRMFPLFLESKKGIRRLYIQLVGKVAFLLLKGLGLIESINTDTMISHPEIYPEVPIVGRPGIRLPYVKYFGLHYQILRNKIIVTMMPALQWKVSNEKFIAVLTENLERIKLLYKKK